MVQLNTLSTALSRLRNNLSIYATPIPPGPCSASVQMSSPQSSPRFEKGATAFRPAPRSAAIDAAQSPDTQLKTKKRNAAHPLPRPRA